MSIELILGGVGTFLGLANFIYWAWWSKREKVAVISASVYAFLETKNDMQRLNAAVSSAKTYTLRLSAGCDLVLVKGEQEIKILGVNIRFNEKLYNKLATYFELPIVNLLPLLTYNSEGYSESARLLRPKVPVSFNNWVSFEARSNFEEEQGKRGDEYADVSIDSLLRQFKRGEYELYLIRYDGKVLRWKFPDKWWRNLGKKIWG